jgi:hypothetical protein
MLGASGERLERPAIAGAVTQAFSSAFCSLNGRERGRSYPEKVAGSNLRSEGNIPRPSRLRLPLVYRLHSARRAI